MLLEDRREFHKVRWREEAPGIPYGYCQCGCGQTTKRARETRVADEAVAGCPKRFIHTHHGRAGHRARVVEHRRRWAEEAPGIPYGRCWCGCGELAPTSTSTDPKRGMVIGEPRHYVQNHHRRKSGVAWIEEDRGYTTPCYIWQRARDKKGYAMVYVEGRAIPAHRFFYEERHGRLPEDYDAHHLCEVKPCVRLDHLQDMPHGEHTRLHCSLRTAWTGRDIDLSEGACQSVGLIDEGVGEVEVSEVPSSTSEKLPHTGGPE